MLSSFFINACMVIAFISFSFHLYHSRRAYFITHPFQLKVLFGIITGIAGALLMIFSYKITDGIVIDYRNFAIITSAAFGGLLSSSITVAIMLLSRISAQGFSPVMITLIISMSILAVGSSIISKLINNFASKWLVNLALYAIVSATSIFIFLRENSQLGLVFLYFFIGSTMLAYVLYKILSYYINYSNSFVQLAEQSTTDHLTGINNARGFDEEFNKAINYCSRKETSLSFMMIDIDFFKKINDTYGHTTGDEVLKQLAIILKQSVRSYDIVSRNGGEEFSVILQDCPQILTGLIAERIRFAVDNFEFTINNLNIHITVSIGVSSFPDHTDAPDKIKELADRALYHAKRTGRNRVVNIGDFNE